MQLVGDEDTGSRGQTRGALARSDRQKSRFEVVVDALPPNCYSTVEDCLQIEASDGRKRDGGHVYPSPSSILELRFVSFRFQSPMSRGLRDFRLETLPFRGTRTRKKKKKKVFPRHLYFVFLLFLFRFPFRFIFYSRDGWRPE